MLPTTAVVMSTYGRRDALPRILPALLEQDATEYVLVVNGSRDGSLELLREATAGDDRVQVLFLENKGLTNAQWVAAQTATSDVVLFVDDDVLLHPGLVRGHALRHAEAPRRVVVGFMPTRVPERPGPRSFTTRLYAQEYLGVVGKWERDPASVLPNLWMGNVSFRREDYLGLQAHLGAPGLRYHQDKHLGVVAQRAGLEAVFDRTLRADHVHERSLEAFLEQARRQGWDQRLIHELHPDVLGPYDPARFEAGLARPVRALLSATTAEPVRRPVVAALSAAVGVTGRTGRYGVQTNIAKLLRRIETQHGARSYPNG
ncbi:glycosyltransferase family 2 protein [Kineococcus auxinigenes]|uniref:glycosyltransferase family 2 protein n=1 Tax=unclassified Kineococcus TaxID=2621656 RepID=UPI003D7E464D